MSAPVFPPARTRPPKAELLLAFLRRGPFPTSWVLRGSVVTRAHHPAGRAPVDLDYVVVAESWEPDVVVAEVRRLVAASPHDEGARLHGDGIAVVPIWEETTAPGVRVTIPAEVERERDELQIDFAFGDPIVVPNEPIVFEGVGPLLAVARETLVAWKIHGLVEWGRGRWRPKDLFDLDLLLSAPLRDEQLRAALDVAFSSRKTDLAALADLVFRPRWGESTGRRKLWQKLAERYPHADFPRARGRVVAALERLGIVAALAHLRAAVLAEDDERTRLREAARAPKVRPTGAR